jgi:hypothetical protein
MHVEPYRQRSRCSLDEVSAQVFQKNLCAENPPNIDKSSLCVNKLPFLIYTQRSTKAVQLLAISNRNPIQ